MSTKIKICGLTRAQDIRTANALQLDYIGFVFAPKSKRFVPPEQAKQLRRCGVFGFRYSYISVHKKNIKLKVPITATSFSHNIGKRN